MMNGHFQNKRNRKVSSILWMLIKLMYCHQMNCLWWIFQQNSDFIVPIVVNYHRNLYLMSWCFEYSAVFFSPPHFTSFSKAKKPYMHIKLFLGKRTLRNVMLLCVVYSWENFCLFVLHLIIVFYFFSFVSMQQQFSVCFSSSYFFLLYLDGKNVRCLLFHFVRCVRLASIGLRSSAIDPVKNKIAVYLVCVSVRCV